MKRKPKRNAKIEKFFREGYSLLEIGKKFGISRERARQVIKERERNRREFRRLSRLKEEEGF